MALQLWMPLMGDLRNQGLGDYSISTLGTLSWVSGKLGSQALKAGDGTQVVNGVRIEDTFTELLNGDYSVSVWVKPYGQHIHYNGSIFSSGNWNTANKRWAFGVSQDNTKVDVLCSNYNTYINCTVPVNEWTHLICACGSDRIVKLYKNGEYIASLDRSTANAFDSDNVFTCIGRESYANGYFSFNGAIQDFRLYNHCLSELEIKQLSQGLILHYPLNRMGFGQDNLATCTTPQYVINASSTSNYNYFWINSSTLEPNTTYTFSAEVEVSDNIKQCTIYNYTSSGNSGSLIHTFPADGKRHSWTFTTTTTGLGLIGYAGNSGATVGHSAIYRNIKVEKDDKATPYIPRSNEVLYTTMGLNGTTEYDCSGFCNNGIWHGVHTNTSDTPKYAVSTTATGSSTTYLEGPVLPAEAKTVALWIKNTSKSSNGAIFNDKTTGLQIGLLNSLLYMNSKASTAGFTTTHWVNGEWNHVVAVNNNGTRSLYVNGQPETQSGASNYYIHNADNCWLWNRSYNNNYPFNGSLSDLRVYATALSADDIKSLYESNKL